MKNRVKIAAAIVLLTVMVGCKQVVKQDSDLQIVEQGIVLENLDIPWQSIFFLILSWLALSSFLKSFESYFVDRIL